MEKWRKNERIVPVTRDGFRHIHASPPPPPLPPSIRCPYGIGRISTQRRSRYNEKKREEELNHPVSGHASMLSLNRPASSPRHSCPPFFAPFFLPFFPHSTRWMVPCRGVPREGRRGIKQGAKGGCRYREGVERRGAQRYANVALCVTSSFIPDFAVGLRGESAKTPRPPPPPSSTEFRHRSLRRSSTIVVLPFSSPPPSPGKVVFSMKRTVERVTNRGGSWCYFIIHIVYSLKLKYSYLAFFFFFYFEQRWKKARTLDFFLEILLL